MSVYIIPDIAEIYKICKRLAVPKSSAENVGMVNNNGIKVIQPSVAIHSQLPSNPSNNILSSYSLVFFHLREMCGARISFFGFKNTGRFSCFQIGDEIMSSLNTPFLSGVKGGKYGTPKDVVVVKSARCIKIPIESPKKPANAPQKNIYKS